MVISIIAAMGENRVIGRNNALPWDLAADRKRFRKLTLGHPVIMGRETYESIGHALPERKNIIVTRREDYEAKGCFITRSLSSALTMVDDEEEVFICGGGEIYRDAIHLADRIYLTIIHRTYQGDTFFPEIPDDFRCIEREEIEGNPSFSFLVLTR